MSLRPMLFASSVKPLLNAVHSRDISLVPRLVEWFRTHLNQPDQATLDMAESEAENLLSGAIAGESESEEQVHIVAALAKILGVQNDAAMIADGYWKQGAWDDYYNKVHPFLDPSVRKLFGYLIQTERPLFGKSINTGWSYYGYLLRDEVRQLRTGIQATAVAHPEIAAPTFLDGFHNEIIGWLLKVEERGEDLWLFAY